MADRPPALVLEERLGGLVKPDTGNLLSVLVYGAPGVGKTVLAGTAQDDARTRPVLVCSAEGGHKSILWRLSVPESDPRHDGLAIKEIVRFPEDLYAVIDVVAENPGLVRTVVIDSITDIAWRVEQSMLRKPNPERKAPNTLAWSEWAPFNTAVRTLVTMIRDLNVHVIATALETEKESSFGPLAGGKKTAELLPGFFDSVHRLAIVGEPETTPDGKRTVLAQHRELVLTADSRMVAKDRNDPLGLLPRTMRNPTVSKLLDRSEEGMRLAAEQPHNDQNNHHKPTKKENS